MPKPDSPEKQPLPEHPSSEKEDAPKLSLLELEQPRIVAQKKSLESLCRAEVEKHGKDGSEALIDAVKKNRVVGVADIHTSGTFPNSVLFTLTEMMPELKKAGITHMALEVNKRNHQAILNDVMKEKRFDRETGKGIEFNDDWVKLLEAAAKCGITLVAVDDNPERHPIGQLTRKENQHREMHMAKEIAHIVDSDPNARVLWPVGDLHLARRTGDAGYKWAGGLLAEKAKEKGWTMKTYLTDMAGPRHPFPFLNVDKPTEVNLKDAKTIANLQLAKGQLRDPRMPDSRVGDFDAILFVPWDQQLKPIEKQLAGKPEKLLPVMEKWLEHFAGDDVHQLMLCERMLPLEQKLSGAKSERVGCRYLNMSKLCSNLNRNEEAARYQRQGLQNLEQSGR